MSSYYVLNLETSRLELHFAKATYDALPPAVKQEIKSVCLWSNFGKCWVSRTKNSHWRAEQLAKSLGLEDKGREGERLTFAEQQDQKAERAEARVERMEDRKADALVEADQRFNSVANRTLADMQGEPVKIGHHSEKRHRKLIAKAWDDMAKGAAAYDKSKHYATRAEAARRTASQKELSDRGFLMRRIREHEAELRGIARRMEECDDGSTYLARLEELAEVEGDKLGFYRECLDAVGGVAYSRENVAKGDRVFARGDWYTVERCNPTTVSVVLCEPHPCAGWKFKRLYAEIQKHEPAQQISACEDRQKG